MKDKMKNRRLPRSLRAESGLALGLSTAVLLPLSAIAQTVPVEPVKEQQLPAVTVKNKKYDPNPNAEVGVPYKAKTSGDSRHTRPLAETPQTISVITKTAIDDSGYTDLKQILGAQPGITLGTGENGNAFGDRYIIRGQEARSDVFVDGLRDPGMTTRESFAIEQLEVSKGPNSSFAGRGTAGGAINAITKQATLDYDFTRFSTAVGTDRHVRVTADVNKIFTDHLVLRANVLYGYEDVPDRDPANRKRKGLALSGTYEFSPQLSLTLDYYGILAKDRPDLGSYLSGTVPNRKPTANVPAFAQKQDFLTSDVDTFTARVQFKPSNGVKINSLTRYGASDNAYVVTGANSTTAFAGTTRYTSGRPSTHSAWQEVDYFAHQTNFEFLQTRANGLKHELIVSLEYTDHHVVKGSFTNTNTGAFNCATASGGPLNNYCITGPNGAPVANLENLLGRRIVKGMWNADWRVGTGSFSIMDTFDFTKSLTLFSGIRADVFDFSLRTRSGAGALAQFRYSDTLVNGNLGLTYKLNPQGMVYVSYATAGDINGGESDTGTSSGYGGLVLYQGQAAGAKPETTQNFEVGTKWNVMDDKLLLTAAAFRTTKSDVMEGANYDALGTFNTGKNRVQGIELGLTGEIWDKLTAQVGLAVMRSKVLKSATPINVNRSLSNFANNSLSAQLKYQFTDAFSFGGAMKYESRRYGGQPDTGAVYANGYYSQPVPSFAVFDLFGNYRFNKHLEARLNILNVGDRDYYTSVYRSGAFLYKGDARAVRLTLNYEL